MGTPGYRESPQTGADLSISGPVVVDPQNTEPGLGRSVLNGAVDRPQ